jgi:hypothetical protein
MSKVGADMLALIVNLCCFAIEYFVSVCDGIHGIARERVH